MGEEKPSKLYTIGTIYKDFNLDWEISSLKIYATTYYEHYHQKYSVRFTFKTSVTYLEILHCVK